MLYDQIEKKRATEHGRDDPHLQIQRYDQPYKKITYIYSFIEDILIRQFKLGNSLYLKYKKNQSIGERFDIINSDTLHYFTWKKLYEWTKKSRR